LELAIELMLLIHPDEERERTQNMVLTGEAFPSRTEEVLRR
jgi:hypothetical protein